MSDRLEGIKKRYQYIEKGCDNYTVYRTDIEDHAADLSWLIGEVDRLREIIKKTDNDLNNLQKKYHFKGERAQIRTELNQVLKRFTRQELLAHLFNIPWGRTNELKDLQRMKQTANQCSGLSNEDLIKKILDRDVEETYKFRHLRV